MIDDDKEVKEWNFAKDYYKTISNVIIRMGEARLSKDIKGWYDALRFLFNLVSPYCWDVGDKARVMSRKKLLALGSRVYGVPDVAGSSRDGVEMTRVFDLLDGYEASLLERMHAKGVLSPLQVKRDWGKLPTGR